MEQKKQMAEIIEMSNSAYEARDEAQAKIIVFELDRALEQDRKLKEFMATKVADRGENLENGFHLKESGNKNMQSQDDVSESLDTYEKAFAEIRKVTGTQDIGELVQRFKAIEKMAEEIVHVQRRIDGLKVEMVAAEEETKRIMRDWRFAHLISFTNTLEQSKEKCGHYEKDYLETTQLLDDLRKGTERLIKLFRATHLASCIPKPVPAAEGETAVEINKTEEEKQQEESEKDGKPEVRSMSARMRAEFAQATDALLGSHGVTDTNLLQCLGLVELKANELLTLHYVFNNQKKSSAGEDKGDAKERPMAVVNNLTIVAPSTGDDHDGDDDISDEEDRPLTREELTQKTLRGLSKREKTAGAPKTAQKKKKKQA
ncbi:hypothetical protein BCR33DRAFT_715418 [Rhizoclosmatium globosum]|uniref:ODAD1 central coiled coil region domain-containing protein n=1 Tax=Rhizoclosmatium globosum TaxID=329046 RepID=A0A1Y2CJ51_9FUNG|nr:hypothetical protein BCR33DRAFT_715418 [Rhizoclosmatium globosum]|eukprot:ORY47049.1 hypothetical protein BCR33DRAFT_715418 [Rhizoclosmatium globosum]